MLCYTTISVGDRKAVVGTLQVFEFNYKYVFKSVFINSCLKTELPPWV